MQQTKSYWRMAALAGAAGLVTAFVGSACVVTTSTDDGGASGESTAGAATAGATSTAGAAGATTAGAAGAAITAGAAGTAPTPYDCDVANGGAVGTPSVCTPAVGSETDPCALCVQAHCCTEFTLCYAYNPGDQCGYGGPNDMGEISCVQQCIQEGVMKAGAYEPTLVGTCANDCTTETSNGSSKDCGPVIGQQTSDLVGCLADSCQTECFGG